MQPDQLKRKEPFRRTFRGYRPDETDEYIDHLLEKYGELFRENRELALRLQVYTGREDALRQKEADGVARLREAEARAAAILTVAEERGRKKEAEARATGEELLARAREDVAVEEERLRLLRAETAEFHRTVCALYRESIDRLNAVAEGKIEAPETEAEPEPETAPAASSPLFDDEVETVPFVPPVQPAPRSQFEQVYGRTNDIGGKKA